MLIVFFETRFFFFLVIFLEIAFFFRLASFLRLSFFFLFPVVLLSSLSDTLNAFRTTVSIGPSSVKIDQRSPLTRLPLFLVALSFWVVKNYSLNPAFDTVNWVKMYGRSVFWDTYFRTLLLASVAAIITSVLAFPCSYGIVFKLSERARRLAIFLMVIPF